MSSTDILKKKKKMPSSKKHISTSSTNLLKKKKIPPSSKKKNNDDDKKISHPGCIENNAFVFDSTANDYDEYDPFVNENNNNHINGIDIHDDVPRDAYASIGPRRII